MASTETPIHCSPFAAYQSHVTGKFSSPRNAHPPIRAGSVSTIPKMTKPREDRRQGKVGDHGPRREGKVAEVRAQRRRKLVRMDEDAQRAPAPPSRGSCVRHRWRA